ncbi:MAG: hypothetical protein BJ554DRAFT_1821 [Olpidium bornovanus]|uniref:Uncharacterized protein n=1 Tax=Olpidium bornovanus TaxID=278681 RepID=A0A8H7ZRE7_9FUNG|nr:MAG: hypothetical protein BJ554DRAFT_1821 [Olpidium bornovanus]
MRAVEVEEEEEVAEEGVSWQREEELARLAKAPEGVNQEFWDLYRELTVRTMPVPEGQKAFPPAPHALGDLIGLASSAKELEFVLDVLVSWRKPLLPLTAEHTSAVVNKALRFGDPDLALRYLGNPEEHDVRTDGSHFDLVLAECVRRFDEAKRVNDPVRELVALDQMYLTLAVLGRYEHLPDRLERLASALKTVVEVSLGSSLREGWRRAVIASQHWEQFFKSTEIYAEEDPIIPDRRPVHIPTAFTPEEIERIELNARTKGYNLEDDVEEGEEMTEREA